MGSQLPTAVMRLFVPIAMPLPAPFQRQLLLWQSRPHRFHLIWSSFCPDILNIPLIFTPASRLAR